MENKKKKFIKNFFIFIILIGITFYIIFKDQNLNDMFLALANTKKQYIIIAILCMFADILCESINTRRTLLVLKENTNIFKCIKYTLLNFFFSAITPSSSGGQPMEVYYMHKEKISVANATLAVLIQLCSFQLVAFIFAIVGVCFSYKYLNGTLIAFFSVGMFFNLVALLAFIIAIFSKRLSNGIIKLIVKIMKFFKIKNIDEKEEKLTNEINLYQGGAKYIKKNKIVILRTILTTTCQVLFFYSITYWIYCAFGLNDLNIMQVILVQAVLYTASAGIPLPGAVGVSEGNFVMIYKTIFTQGTINSAMLLSRGASFYLYVLISGIVVIFNRIYHQSKKSN